MLTLILTSCLIAWFKRWVLIQCQWLQVRFFHLYQSHQKCKLQQHHLSLLRRHHMTKSIQAHLSARKNRFASQMSTIFKISNQWKIWEWKRWINLTGFLTRRKSLLFKEKILNHLMSEENLQHSECQINCLTLSIIKMNHETTKVRLKNYRLSKNIWFQILLHKQDILNKRTQEMTAKIELALLN